MSDPNPDNMSREELLESLRTAELQRDMVDDLIRKQQDMIKLMEQKMEKISTLHAAEKEKEGAPDGPKPDEDKPQT